MSEDVYKTLIERRHPEYREMLSHWLFMRDSYLGGRKWFEDNIFRYIKEGDKEFSDRVERAYRFNHTREIVDLVNKYLFRGQIQRLVDDAPSSVVKFWNKSTRQGLSIDEFMRIASTKASIGGRPWIFVDSTLRIPNSDDAVISKAEEEEAEIYVYVVSPEDVLDMSYDSAGDLNWILVREIHRDDDDPFVSSGDLVERFRLWGRNEWMLLERTYTSDNTPRVTIIDAGITNLGEVPAVKLDNTISDNPWYSPALIADIAYLDRAAANYASNLDAIIQDQTFSQLAMPAQNVLPGDDAYNQILQMGTKRIFLYDGESGTEPKYLSPDPRQAQLIISAIEKIISEIYHSVGLAGERTKQDNSQSIDNSSGVAKAFDFERVTALLTAKAKALEIAENKVARLVALYAGEEDQISEGIDLVKYSETFDVRSLRDELDIALQLSVVGLPREFRSEQAKIVVDKLFPSLGEKLKEELKSAVDNWEDELREQFQLSQESQEASKIVEEASRNRDRSGDKQSDTKSRENDKS